TFAAPALAGDLVTPTVYVGANHFVTCNLLNVSTAIVPGQFQLYNVNGHGAGGHWGTPRRARGGTYFHWAPGGWELLLPFREGEQVQDPRVIECLRSLSLRFYRRGSRPGQLTPTRLRFRTGDVPAPVELTA